MKKIWLLLTVLCIFSGVFVSCNHNDQKKKEIIIAIIPKVDNEIFDQVKESAMESAKELGIVVTWEAPTSIDGKKQKELIDNLIRYKVDGILISCNDADLVRESINAATEAGIMVGTFDSDCPRSSRIFYIGTDNMKAGEVCANTMLDLYKKANKDIDQIVILSGGMSADNMKARLSGFRSVIDESKIGNVLYSFEIPEYGKELLSLNLTQNKKTNGIQMIWGVPVLNGIDSIPALKKFMNDGGISVFFDVSKPLLRYIMNNQNCATMKQDFHSMGKQGVINMYNAIKEKPYNKKILYNVKVIDKNNAEEELNNL